MSSMDVARLGQLITPEIPANGKGYRAFYSFRNLVEMRLEEQMGKLGIPQKRVQKMVEDLRKTRWRWLDYQGRDGVVVLDSLYRWGAGDTVEKALEPLSMQIPVTSFIAVDLGIIKRAIRKNIEQNITEGETS